MPGDITLTARDRAEARALPAVDLEPDSAFGRYVIRGRLGAGGMGVVYEAWDGELDRDVALKVIRSVGNVHAKRARLRREARAMARLSHPNVVPVFDIGTHHDQLFIAMELVRGPSLRAWLQPGARDWRDIVRVFVDAGRGLIAAHAGGVLHRDFKPDNVLVGRDGAARITDFGLARELAELEPGEPVDDAGRDTAVTQDGDGGDRPLSLPQVTGTGGCSGTPAYMAP
ncbi:MAG TPA: serine/threonine-protein kinase [Kofleriaceae bacterium]